MGGTPGYETAFLGHVSSVSHITMDGPAFCEGDPLAGAEWHYVTQRSVFSVGLCGCNRGRKMTMDQSHKWVTSSTTPTPFCWLLFTVTHSNSILLVGPKLCHLTATGRCKPEWPPDLELTSFDGDLGLIPGLFTLISCSFPS